MFGAIYMFRFAWLYVLYKQFYFQTCYYYISYRVILSAYIWSIWIHDGLYADNFTIVFEIAFTLKHDLLDNSNKVCFNLRIEYALVIELCRCQHPKNTVFDIFCFTWWRFCPSCIDFEHWAFWAFSTVPYFVMIFRMNVMLKPNLVGPINNTLSNEQKNRFFLHDRPWISPWIKSISNELDITTHVIASQLSHYCGVISNRLWRHQQNEDRASETRGRCVKIVVFSVIDSLAMSCKNKIIHVLSWWTVSVLTRVLFLCLFPSLLRNKNNSLVSTETVSHSSTYNILYIGRGSIGLHQHSWTQFGTCGCRNGHEPRN